jgi:hypothetical protein
MSQKERKSQRKSGLLYRQSIPGECLVKIVNKIPAVRETRVRAYCRHHVVAASSEADGME